MTERTHRCPGTHAAAQAAGRLQQGPRRCHAGTAMPRHAFAQACRRRLLAAAKAGAGRYTKPLQTWLCFILMKCHEIRAGHEAMRACIICCSVAAMLTPSGLPHNAMQRVKATPSPAAAPGMTPCETKPPQDHLASQQQPVAATQASRRSTRHKSMRNEPHRSTWAHDRSQSKPRHAACFHTAWQ